MLPERYPEHVFEPGTVHYAAEVGSIEKLKECEEEGLRHGYPAAVTLQRKDELLNATPLHLAAEAGQTDVVKVPCASTTNVAHLLAGGWADFVHLTLCRVGDCA